MLKLGTVVKCRVFPNKLIARNRQSLYRPEALREVHQAASPSSSVRPARYLPGSYGERSLAEDPCG